MPGRRAHGRAAYRRAAVKHYQPGKQTLNIMVEKEKIRPGKYVELGYDLYTTDADGTETLVHQTDTDDPERIVYGVTPGVIEPLEKAILDLEEGGEFDVRAKADEAFGQPDPEQIVPLEREIFLIDGKFDTERIYPGAVVPMMTAEGYRITGTVKEVGDKIVKVDFNHPLAGKDLRFKGRIITVREATPEDLQPAGCGCRGGGCGDGGCEGGNCGQGGCGEGSSGCCGNC